MWTGVLIHFAVALGWSIVFAVMVRVRAVRLFVNRRYGVIYTAALYGPFIWMVMSLVLIPLFTHRPPAITPRWWVQFFGHILFVGMPIVAVTKDAK